VKKVGIAFTPQTVTKFRQNRLSDISLKVDALVYISVAETRYIFNRFYALRPGSYRIRWNNV